MAYQFKKHYSREEARALLPQVRRWLEELGQSRKQWQKTDERVVALMALCLDRGGELVNSWVRQMVNLQEALVEFQSRDIIIKDIDRGLIDFPAILGGKEVFLCWEKDEDDIEFWHDLDSGYAGRERL